MSTIHPNMTGQERKRADQETAYQVDDQETTDQVDQETTYQAEQAAPTHAAEDKITPVDEDRDAKHFVLV